jgi:Ca2+-binding RTX toxin-like protein
VNFHQFKALMTAGWGVVISDGPANGSFDGDFNYTADGVDQSVTFTVTLTPPADSDLDVASTLAGLDLAVSATAKDGALVSPVTGPVAIDVNVDAVADGETQGLSVNIVSIVDSNDANSSFGVGETGKITVLATFGDFTDSSEIHEVIITLPEGFSYDETVHDLPSGVTYDASASDDGKAVFKVSSENGPDSVTIELAVTNDSSVDGLVQFKAEAKAIETETPHDFPADGECDPSDNLAQVQDQDNAEVESAPVLVVGENTDDEGDEPQDHRIKNPDGQPDGNIVGNGTSDVLVGDVGGTSLVGKVTNIALVLDVSSSMDMENIVYNNVEMSRADALNLAVEALLDELAGAVGATVRVHIVTFGTSLVDYGTFDIVTNGIVDNTALTNAKDFDVTPSGTQYTNYEAGFQGALDWFEGDRAIDPLANADSNQTIFLSDGAPNRYYTGNGTSVGGSGTSGNQTSLDHVLGALPGTDTVNEIEALQAYGSVDVIGLDVGDAQALGWLDDVDGEGDASNVSTGDELEQVLADLSQGSAPDDVGSDSILGGGGNDLIFGDTVFTDKLKALLSDGHPGKNLPNGSGWAVIEALIDDGYFDQVPGQSVNEEIMNFLRSPANQTTYELFRESVGSDGQVRDGGHDTIDGGAGNDTIYGQEGDDIIVGGTGQDVIAGGTGNDTMTGGTGERDTFRWTAADHGSVAGGGVVVATYNFAGVTQATNNHFAFEFDVDNSPNDPTDLDGFRTDITGYGSGNEATDDDYEDLAASDGNRWEKGPNSGNGDNNTQVFWAQFTIDEDVNDITQIELLIEGRQENESSGDPAYLAVWNYTDSQWEILDQELTDSDYNFVGSLTGSSIHEYLDDSTNQITFMLMNGDDGDDLDIDFVEVEVTSSTAGISDPDTDTITDFEFTNGAVNANNDVLDLGDLLPGSVTGATSAADLAEYLSFTYAGGNTTVHVDHDGGGTFQPTLNIVLENVDLTNGGSFGNDEQIIQALINGNQLVV